MYVKTKVYLSDNQIGKIKSAFKNNQEVTLQINKSKPPNYDLHLTNTQLNQIEKGKRIKLSKTQLEKTGGFLPFLIPLLTSLGLGAVGSLGSFGTKKILEKISGSGLKKKPRGKGVYLNSEYPTK